VGIGASAGGLEALKKLFAAVPPDSGIAFVVVPHLDPAHASLMVSLLAKSTALPVSEVWEGMQVEPNHVYVIPPNRLLTVRAGALYLTQPAETRVAYTSIDWFLRSLAEDRREYAICILLSGTGRHGSAGLRAIKANDGAAFVQDPATAEFPQMPQSAIATGLVDQVLPVERIPAAVLEYCRHLRLGERSAINASDQDSANLDRILALLNEKTRLNFRNYRTNTLLRRIERRASLARVNGLAEYLAYLHEHRDEVDLLAKNFMISVTRFFREPEAFKVLEATVIPDLVRRKSDAEPLRAWVPGCATGEEAYSIAILFLEQLSAADKRCPLKIFASDVDEAALRLARAGIYPASISSDVSPARLEKFYRPVGEHS
jgi:two-component system CheB/CheR fusion protein